MEKIGLAILAFLIGCSWLNACSSAKIPDGFFNTENEQEFSLPAETETLVDIIYAEKWEQAQKLDIIQPKKRSNDPMPVILFIHGGGFEEGDKRDGWEYLLPFVENGFLGVSINYRLSPQAIFPAQIEDVKSAIRYLRVHAEKFNLDPMRIGVWGASAGGHLAALVGTSHGVKEMENGSWQEYSSEVQAVCDWY